MKNYSYQELKNVIKVGDEVRAIKGKNNPCAKLKDDGSNTQKITQVDQDRFYINTCYHSYTDGGYLEIVPTTLEIIPTTTTMKNYSYQELKNVIKVGDEVRAIKGKGNPCSELRDDGSNTQKITQVNEDGFWIHGCYHPYAQGGYLEIVPTTNTMTYQELKNVIKVGDEVRAIKGKNNPCGQIKKDGSNTQRITWVNEDGFSINNCHHSYTEGGYLEIVPTTLENVPTINPMKNYSYKELKNVIKVGDEVRAIKGESNPCGELRDDSSNTQKITRVDQDGFSINRCHHSYTGSGYLEIVPTTKTMKYEELKNVIKVGDEVRAIDGKTNLCSDLKDDGSNTRKITEVNGYGFRINGCHYSYTEYGYLEIVPKTLEIVPTTTTMKNYSYQELKNVIKVGYEVRAIKGKNNPCGKIKDDGSDTRKITRVDQDGFCINKCYHSYTDNGYLEIVPRTLENLAVGDLVLDASGFTRRVLVDLGGEGEFHVYVLSNQSEHNAVYRAYTVHEMKQANYTPFVEVAKPAKMTHAEIEAKLGHAVELV